MERKTRIRQLAGLTLALAVTGPLVAQNTGDPVAAGDRDGPRRPVARAIAQLDSDGDRQISQSEFVDARLDRATRRFERRDGDDDGFVSEADFEGREPPADFDVDAYRACVAEALAVDVPEPITRSDRFAAVDLDGDGLIDLEEALTHASLRAEDRFAALDTDRDGFLTAPEFLEGMADALRVRAVRRECRAEQELLSAVISG